MAETYSENKMDKNNTGFGTIVVIICLIVLIGMVWPICKDLFFNEDNPSYYTIDEEDLFEDTVFENKIVENSSDIKSIFLHWRTLPIKYYFSEENNCSKEQRIKIEQAILELTNQSDNIISFSEERSSNAIRIQCLKEEKFNSDSSFAGSGGVGYYQDTNEIINGSITMYRVNCNRYECTNKPVTELHELLHAFGIDHKEDKKSIMHPIEIIKSTKIDKDIITCLKDIYSKNTSNSCDSIRFIE